MISDEQIEKALDYLRDNAKLVGQLRGQKVQLEHMIKVIKAQKFLACDGTVAERQAIADASPEVVAQIEDLKDCVTELETVLTLMKGAELKIEVWRTQNANLRRGNI
jgi:hypothetical protein